MIVRIATLGVMVDMTKNTEAYLGIFVQDLSFGHVVGQRGRDKFLILEDLLQQLAYLLAPSRAWILLQNAMAVGGELLKRMRHWCPSQPSSRSAGY